jgi:thiamine-monophosphate kinase
MDEFELIDRYFRPLGTDSPGVDLGIGDDAAILDPPAHKQLVVTTDTHVEAVHFPTGADARDIGFRSCATSHSDIAAMGAAARWASLALTIPKAEDTWLSQFALGAAEALTLSGAVLIGGDTTAGPLVISWHIIGTVAVGAALRRGGAGAGDAVYVSGTLGDAAAAVEMSLTGDGSDNDIKRDLRKRYWHPEPRFDLARKLRRVATACIDISDGLLADLAHIAAASGCGAVVEYPKLPISPALLELAGPERAHRLAAAGGDDYELCFTVPAANESELFEIAHQGGFRITRIGSIVSGAGVRVIDDAGEIVDFGERGYRHFD